MIAADPLTPAMELELSATFMAGEVGIAHKPQMGLEAGLGKGLTQARDAAGNATGPGIRVRTFKTEEVKLHKYLFINRLNAF
jgi:hypothetical protein